ncbi:MAG TPA: TonB-dependent receptor plug domain-containing protein [Lacibacter sp.]|nr:TonB-dependent receptor plug domain-containing protein [Lacibacter sp.]
MKKWFIYILLLLSTAAQAQNKYFGRVVDELTNEPVEGAFIQSGTFTAVSSKDGGFAVVVDKSQQNIFISAVGYGVQLIELSNAAKEIKLKPAAVNLKEVVIRNGNQLGFANTISKIDVNLRPVNSAQDLLRYVPGLFIAQHQGGGKAEQIFLRGFDVDHGTDVQITVDGMAVNMVSHAHGQGYADLHFVIPELVKNIDYGKGAYYADKGNFNTAGYVELQTKNHLDKNSFQLEAGMFNTYRALAMMNVLPKENKKQNAYIAAELMYSDGPFESEQNFNRFNIWGKYHLHLNERTKFVASANVFNSRWDASGQIPERAVTNGTITRFGAIDNTESGYTGRININTKLIQRLRNNDLLEYQAYYSRYHFNLFSNFTFFLNDPVNGDQIKQTEFRDIWSAQAKYQFTRANEGWNFYSAVGTGIRYDETSNSELSHTLRKTTVLERIQLGAIREANAFVYADEKIEKGKWLLNGGIRADYFQFGYNDQLNPALPRQQQVIISPKVNIQYTAGKQVQVYFKNGKGFHSNDARVVLPQQGREILPASFGSDLGVVWKPFPSVIINTALWHLFLQQEFVYVGDAGIVEPGGRTRRMGVDVSARVQLHKTLFADANFNYAHARNVDDPKGENYIPLAPDVTSTGGIQYQNGKGWSASLRYRYIKDRAANEDYSITAKGYFIADAAVNYTRSRVVIGAAVENMLNAQWNEAQFATESRLRNETEAVNELHFTPGNPFFVKLKLTVTL